MRRFDGEDYLRMYPSLNKWINTCIRCGTKGYKPEMPANDEPYGKVGPTATWKTLRTFFNVLPLNNNDECEQCSKATNDE